MDLSVLGLTKEIKFRLKACVLTENEIKLEQYGFSNNINVESVILFAVEFIGFFYYDLTRSFLIILKEFVMNLG